MFILFNEQAVSKRDLISEKVLLEIDEQENGGLGFTFQWRGKRQYQYCSNNNREKGRRERVSGIIM